MFFFFRNDQPAASLSSQPILKEYLVLQNEKYDMTQNDVHGVEVEVLPGPVEEYVVYEDSDPRDGKRILLLKRLAKNFFIN